MITISQALERSAARLAKVSDTPALDSQTLLAHCLGESRAWLLTHPQENLTKSVFSAFEQEINELERGIPLPYVLGHWEFYGLDFTLTPDTLIPRPETELLVDMALDWLNFQAKPCLIADIGTGSGCIAIALAKHHPGVSVLATDISHPALKIAYRNAIKHDVGNKVHFMQTDLFPPIAGRFDLICANLPYIPSQTLQDLEVSGREPVLALNGGHKGLDLITSLLAKAPALIVPGGILLLEIESSQGDEVQNLTKRSFPTADISLQPDLSGQDRLVAVQMPEGN